MPSVRSLHMPRGRGEPMIIGTVDTIRSPRRARRLVQLCCAVAAITVAGEADAQSLAMAPIQSARPVIPAAPSLPGSVAGAWQLRMAGRAIKLRADYTIEIKINTGGRQPIALISYFAGDQRRPSSICRTQLSLLSNEGEAAVFSESLNYRMGKDRCPIWDQVTIAPRDGGLWVQWRDVAGRKATVKMEGQADRASGGAECRTVGGDGGSGGQLYCRTPDGDWTAKPR